MSSTVGRRTRERHRSYRQRLEEAEETIRAIRNGEVDAFVMRAAETEQVIPLEPADSPYRLLVERMQQAALTLDPDEHILYCNGRFSDMIGRASYDVYDIRFSRFLDPRSETNWQALIREAMEKGSSQGELTIAGAAGSLPVYASLTPFGRGIVGLSVMLTDLTDQKRHEQVLAAETLSRSILEQAADGIVVCDERGIVIRASEAAHGLCGRNPILLPFDAAFPLLVEDSGGERRFELAPVLAGETRDAREGRLRRPDGEVVDLLLRAAPLRQDGKTIGCVVTLTDIRDRKRAEEAMREADRRKDEFLAVLGHELRNALGPIHNAALLMTRLEEDGKSGEAARQILERQVAHMTRIIDDLLDVSRIARGDMTLLREPLNLVWVVRTTVEDYRSALGGAGLELALELPKDPLWVSADATRLAQALGNTLHNAAKFTDAGGRVTIRAERDDGRAVVCVRDTGIGMDAEGLSRVFDYFNQSELGRQRSRGGLGLGMAIARGIVELHGGTIRATSEGPGRGSEFCIRLPLESGPSEALRSARSAPSRQTARRILIIEDNADMADSLRMLLELNGHEVRRAADGPTGVDLARHFRPELVLCDIALPNMDGYAVARELRRDSETAGAYLVALSGYARDDDQRRAAEAGFDLHVSKPLDFSRLDAVIDALPVNPGR
jgi:PAS domain S-box-containing protein